MFIKSIIDVESKTFVVHVAELEALEMTIYPLQTAQITGNNPIQVAALKQNEILIEVLVEYSNFADVFSAKEALVLPEYIELNEHSIELENSKQLHYRSIYSLRPVELETLKTYIKTHLKTGFI